MADEHKGAVDPWQPGLHGDDADVDAEPVECVEPPPYAVRDLHNTGQCLFQIPGAKSSIRVQFTQNIDIARQRLLRILQHPYAHKYLLQRGFLRSTTPPSMGFVFGEIHYPGDFVEGWQLFVSTLLKLQQANKYIASAFQRAGIIIINDD